MHIADLLPCQYHPGHLDDAEWEAPLLAIGWLEHPHGFAVGLATAGFLAKLTQLVSQARSVFSQYNFRGGYDCSFCQATGIASPGPIWSQECIIVPGVREVYAAPGGIVHYVSAHGYCPPPSFVASVFRCPSFDSSEYQEALRKANLGVAPPMETALNWSAKMERDFALAIAARAQRDPTDK